MQTDLLYRIFEHHLYSALVEDEAPQEFIDRVVGDFLEAIAQKGMMTTSQKAEIEPELRDEVLAMLRKKIYGHFSLGAYRRAHFEKLPFASQADPQAGPHATTAVRNRRPS